MKQELMSKKLLIAISAFLVVLGVGVVFMGNGSTSQFLASQFSGTNVTPSNASSLWKPSAENPYRVKITESVATRIDPVITRMLARGSALTADGYQVYLSNLVSGIAKIAAQSNYVSNVEIQNIVSYVSYELTDAKKLLANNNNIVTDITNFFEGNEVMIGTTTSGQAGGGSGADALASEVLNSNTFEEMMSAAATSETQSGSGAVGPVCLLGVPLCSGNTELKDTNTVSGACPKWSCVEKTPKCEAMPPLCGANQELKNLGTGANGCANWSCVDKNPVCAVYDELPFSYCPEWMRLNYPAVMMPNGCPTTGPSCGAPVLVTEWYVKVLGRGADNAGAAFWFETLNRTKNVTQTFDNFVAAGKAAGETVNNDAVATYKQKYLDPKYNK